MPSGLPNLDLSSPGEPCQHSQMCRMVCLVCGKSMLDGDDPKFKPLVELLDELTSSLQEHREQVVTMPGLQMLAEAMGKDLKRNRDKALRKYGLAWIDQWEKPVHRHCAKETPCQCVVPVYSDICKIHKRRLPLIQARARRANPLPQQTMPCNEVERKISAPPNVTIIPASSSKAPSVTLTKATWLQRPSEMASTSSSYRAIAPATSAPPASKKRKPPPAKPNLRLQAAAASCQKIEGFARDTGKERDCLLHSKPHVTEGGEEEYDLDWHNANFDPWKHGDFWRKGQMWFLRPDGKTIPSFEGVRKFTKAGYLVPG